MKFRSGTPARRQAAAIDAAGATLERRLGVGVNLLNVPAGHVLDVIARLRARPEVLYAEPDFLMDEFGEIPGGTFTEMAGNSGAKLPEDAIPNDPSLTLQWAALNTGQNVNGITGVSGADERLTAAWSVSGGPGGAVVIAELDTGVQYSHPDLISNIWTNPGGIGGCPAGTHGYNVLTATCDPMDDDTSYGGHGTHVAGIIGAVANNSAGVAGVNWAIQILPVKWVSATGGNSTSNLITAMDWVIRAKQAGVNIRVANDSPTFPNVAYSQSLSDEIDLLGSNDILFVTPAGNTGQSDDTTPRYPCSYDRPNEICVASTDQSDNLASTSNWGVASVQMAAPGNNIYSTLRLSNYGYISGGSMSAAQVSGAAVLILSQGYLSVSSLRAAILNNVDRLSSLSIYVATSGRLNVCKAIPGCSGAVAATPAALAPPSIVGFQQYGSVIGVSAGSWSGVPARYGYQWFRCDSGGANCAPIPGATSSNYAVLAGADVSAALRATVTAINSFGSTPNQSAASSAISQAASPFSIGSTIQNGQTIGGSLAWTASPSQSVNFVQFYIDGVLSQTDSSSPYTYNGNTTGKLDTTTLSNGTHVLGIRALGSDNRTYGFLGATVTVANGTGLPANTALPVISGAPEQGALLTTSNGSWSNSPSSYAYAWQRCDSGGANCITIAGATASAYTVASADVGFTLRSTVTASNSAGSGSASSAATGVIVSAVAISTSSLPAGQLGAAYSATLSATGGAPPYSWSIVSGALPPGLALNGATGVISGTPTASGTASFTAQVQDAYGRASRTGLSIAIGATSGGSSDIALVQSNSVQGSLVSSVSATFPSANSSGNMIVAFVRMSSATQTVSLTDSAGNSYAQAVSQTQSADGHQSLILYARNIAGGANTVKASFSGSNNHPWLAIYEYSGLANTNPLDQTAHQQGSGTAVSSGAVTTSNSSELIFAGVGLPASYNGAVTAGAGFTLQQQDLSTSRAANESELVVSAGSFAGAFTLSASANWSAVLATFSASGAASISSPAISTASLPNGQQGVAYSATLTASGGATPYTWSVSSGALPPGLTLAATTGVISGSPTASGAFSFTAKVTDANSQTATANLSITVAAPVSGGGSGIGLIQANSVQGSGVPSISAAFPSGNTSGNLIVAFVRMSGTTQTVAITDSAGNPYAQAVTQVQSTDGHQTYIFYARNISAGSNTVTATFSGANNHPWLAVYEFSGLSKTNPLDQTAQAQGSGSVASTGATAVTAAANELIFAGVGLPASYSGSVTPGAGFTLQQQDVSSSRAANESELAAATGSFTAVFNLSATANWTATLATFQ